MASVKICDLDGQMFIERAPGSVRINDGVIYDENSRPIIFSGEFCPNCGEKMKRTRGNLLMLPPPVSPQDKEG